jgi:hypothetical protein
MPVLLDELTDDVLNDIIFLSSEEKIEFLEFIAKELALSISLSYDKRITEVKLSKILFYALTGHKAWAGKQLYSEKELDNILSLYDRAPDFIQEKLEPLMKEFKEEIFSSLE